MDKKKKLIISLIATSIIFVGMIALEKSIVQYTPTIKVVWATKDIKRKEPLDVTSFILKDVPITQVTTDTVKSLDDIKNMYAMETIYANEPLNKKRMGTQGDVETYVLNPGEREIAISFEKIEDTVGGTIRKDDRVDIIYTNAASVENPTLITQAVLQGVRVLGSIDQSGKYIDKYEKNTSATTLLFALPPKDALKLINILATGKIKLIRVPSKDTEYENIKVQNGQVIGGK